MYSIGRAQKLGTLAGKGKKYAAVFLVVVFLISLVPLLNLSMYNRPNADDYNFGYDTAQAWRETASIPQVATAAFRESTESYVEWQGTFSATFLFSLQPGIFGEKYYFIATWLLLLALIGASFYFLYCVIVRLFKQDVWTWLIISSAVTFLCVHHLPSPEEGFFWYNGGIFYTFFYSLFLILMGKILVIPQIVSRHKIMVMGFAIAFLAVFIGGGNYITALLSVLCLGMLSVAGLLQKMKNRWVCWLALLLMTTALLVNALAPGNAVRAAMLEAEGIRRLSFMATILSSFKQAIYYILQWTRFEILAVLLLTLPLMIQISMKLDFSFRYPLLVFTGVFCLFAAQFSPPTLMNVSGSGRFLNIYYYFYVKSAFFCVFYGVGWLLKKNKGQHILKRIIKSSRPQRATMIASVLLLIFMLADFSFGNSVGKIAMQDLKSGKAEQFALERDARLSIYMDESVVDAVVKPLTVIPELFSNADLQGKDFWINQAVAAYYNKASVSLAEE